MKKTILFIALLLTKTVTAQDKSTINELANSSKLEQVKLASDKIADAAATKFEYFKTTDRTVTLDKYKVLIYTPASFTAEDKKEFTPEEKAQCLQIVWLIREDGSYVFKEVTGTEENLLPFWQNTFNTDKSDYRVTPDLKYKYVKNENSVSIVKSY
jgi:hypothetical protein